MNDVISELLGILAESALISLLAYAIVLGVLRVARKPEARKSNVRPLTLENMPDDFERCYWFKIEERT